ncbi:HDOD domain-containing protein [Chitiniphilus purpureus]|uniref:HDOD domain-containing protein n=1 Tax=Chitiniphilus purpureus TaxID=2981137 RepID=A0ABY6DSY2_9NEIS|nr:HDOD domain-containing protein [Chitiniphilus sp. CD1]UXY14998.1 HDOD domain-containing protein [Chitiniphilus sp. CD1]
MRIDDVFEQTHKLPTIPRIVQELIDSFGQDEINVGDIASRISLDQVITAKVLRLANSVHFGASRQIGSVHEAIIVLGFNTVRTLVVAAGVTGAFVNTPGFDRSGFWRASLRVAAVARALARWVGESSDTGFTCGLLHNIGELLIRVVEPDIAAKIDRSVANGGDRVQLQINNIGFDYIRLGAELARRWNFPENIQLALAEQHGTPPGSRLSGVLQGALVLSQAPVGQDPSETVALLPPEVLASLGLTPEQLATGLDDLLHSGREVEDILV